MLGYLLHGGKFGEYGHLIIQDVNVDVPLFKTDDVNEYQSIVDDWNSALMIQHNDGGIVIVDHAYQHFDRIKSCTIGMYAKIETDNLINYYRCEEIDYDAINNGTDVLYRNKTKSIFDGNENGITLYTCNDFHGGVTVVRFRKVSDFDKTVNICSI